MKLSKLAVGAALCGLTLAVAPLASAQHTYKEDVAAATLTPQGTPDAEALGWHVGCQAYSFNRYTFWEAIDKVKAMNLHYIEAYPGQTLCKEHPDAKMGPDLSPELCKETLARLKAADVKLMNFGVVGLDENEANDRKVFDFAKRMGIQTIVSQPPPDSFNLLDKLTEEYGINVALHNHPKPSIYWNPDTVLKACKGHSKRIGACCDIGHWLRSGVNPLQAVKELKGRIICFHFKDLNEFGNPKAHDVPWCTGVANVRAILAELMHQGFTGVFSAEYEYAWENSIPEISQSMLNFNTVAKNLTELRKEGKEVK